MTKEDLINEINTKNEADFISEQMGAYFDDFISENENDYNSLTESEKNEVREAWFSYLKERI